MKQTISQLTQAFIQSVQHQGIPVSAAYLFGSYAKGIQKTYSDIDVCVISPIFGKDMIEEMKRIGIIAASIDTRIEPIPMNQKALQNPYNTLSSEIRTYGKPIPLSV